MSQPMTVNSMKKAAWESMLTHQLVVGRIVDDIQQTGLPGDSLHAKCDHHAAANAATICHDTHSSVPRSASEHARRQGHSQAGAPHL